MAGSHALTWRLEIHDELVSTQDVCLSRVAEGAGLAVLARRQTAPRGSRGRGWTEPAGNLALSAILPGGRAPGEWALLMAVALHEALAALVAEPLRLRVKWPNDILLDGAKLAGILIEAAPGRDGWVVAGFGANLIAAPDIPGRRTACLATIVPPPPPEQVAGGLLDALSRWHACSFAEIRAAWLDAGPRSGERIAILDRGETVTGTFSGLGKRGELLLRIAGEDRAFVTGEVLAAP